MNFIRIAQMIIFYFNSFFCRLSAELSYTRFGYRSERWKWVVSMFKGRTQKFQLSSEIHPENTNVQREYCVEKHNIEEGSDGKNHSASTEHSRETVTSDGNETNVITSCSNIKVDKCEVMDDHKILDDEEDEEFLPPPKPEGFPTEKDISEEQMLKAYGLDRLPLFIPCK